MGKYKRLKARVIDLEESLTEVEDNLDDVMKIVAGLADDKLKKSAPKKEIAPVPPLPKPKVIITPSPGKTATKKVAKKKVARKKVAKKEE